MTPTGCRELALAGCPVLVEAGAGLGSGYSDEDYARAGAVLVESFREGIARADLIVKVKEPLAQEYELLEPRHVLFTYLHLAASRALTEGLLRSSVTALAYETLTDPQGQLPLLRPMSEVAGRMSIQEGARHLLRHEGGRGVLLGGVPGTPPGVVCVIGGGVVGTEAAKIAAGMGAQVVILDKNLDRLRQLAEILPRNVTTLFSSRDALLAELRRADLVVGAVLLRGAKAPHLIHRDDLAVMKHGSVIVDVAIDQGGICETSRPTTHKEPTFVVDGVLHYGVANMPGAVAVSSTQALSNATLPYILALATKGLVGALAKDPLLATAINVSRGELLEPAVAASFDLPLSRALG